MTSNQIFETIAQGERVTDAAFLLLSIYERGELDCTAFETIIAEIRAARDKINVIARGVK